MGNESKINLDNVMIAAPCSVGWDNMTGTDTVRHCHECKLNVYNISQLTKFEAEKLLASEAFSQGKVCLTFYRRHDGTILTADCPKGLRRIRSNTPKILRTIAAAAATVFVSSPAPAQAQNETNLKGKPCATTTNQSGPTSGDKTTQSGSLAVPGQAVGGMPVYPGRVMPVKQPQTDTGKASWTAFQHFTAGQEEEAKGNTAGAVAHYTDAKNALKSMKHDAALEQKIKNALKSAQAKLRKEKKAASSKKP